MDLVKGFVELLFDKKLDVRMLQAYSTDENMPGRDSGEWKKIQEFLDRNKLPSYIDLFNYAVKFSTTHKFRVLLYRKFRKALKEKRKLCRPNKKATKMQTILTLDRV